VAVRSGDTATPDITWSSFGSEISDGSGTAVTAPDARYLQYRATLGTSDSNVTSELQEITVTYRK
jgi:hypothetical protein